MDLIDGFGRRHRDLRISVTDRCNLRCTYCMPADGLDWLPRAEVLTYEEIERLARLFVDRLGVTAIRLTGGEPTVRAELTELVRRLASLDVDLSLTTNGTTLTSQAAPLVAAGLARVNISLDTLRRERFEAITRRDALDATLAGIDAALAAGLRPVKVNMVVMRDVNDDEILDMARFGRERGVEVRFIEFMPLDADGAWLPDAVVGRDEIVARIAEAFPVIGSPSDGSRPVLPADPEPAQRFLYADGAGSFGVIPSVTDAFCDDCDRLRLTAEGQLRTCLFALDEHDLRGPLRAGAHDDELAERIAAAVRTKWAGHRIGQEVFLRPTRSMSQIGG